MEVSGAAGPRQGVRSARTADLKRRLVTTLVATGAVLALLTAGDQFWRRGVPAPSIVSSEDEVTLKAQFEEHLARTAPPRVAERPILRRISEHHGEIARTAFEEPEAAEAPRLAEHEELQRSSWLTDAAGNVVREPAVAGRPIPTFATPPRRPPSIDP